MSGEMIGQGLYCHRGLTGLWPWQLQNALVEKGARVGLLSRNQDQGWIRLINEIGGDHAYAI